MTFKDGVRDGIDDLLTRLKLKRANRRLSNFVFPVLAVAGATAIGWAIQRSVRPRAAARKMHRNIKARMNARRSPAPPRLARKAAA